MNFKPSSWTIVRRTVLIVLALGIVVLIVLQSPKPSKPLPVYGTVPRFSLTAEDGRTFTRSEVEGAVQVVDFIFTRCGGTCPIMSAQMMNVQREFAAEASVRLVSISVDPDHDTPEVLTRYGHRLGANPRQWTFLTGNKSALQDLARNGFHLGVSERGGSPEEPIIHSTKFVLVDKGGRIRGYYDGTEDEPVAQLIQDIKSLLAGD